MKIHPGVKTLRRIVVFDEKLHFQPELICTLQLRFDQRSPHTLPLIFGQQDDVDQIKSARPPEQIEAADRHTLVFDDPEIGVVIVGLVIGVLGVELLTEECRDLLGGQPLRDISSAREPA